MIEEFLLSVDDTFPTPISKKQKIKDFSQKLFNYATICVEVEENKIASMVAGYTDNLMDGMAYISIVATHCKAQGRGLASNCIKRFIDVCREKEISAVHLYTDRSNEIAKTMYRKIGFVKYEPEFEARPNDIHLIYRIEME